jgi:hypothetical protein
VRTGWLRTARPTPLASDALTLIWLTDYVHPGELDGRLNQTSILW